MSLFGVIWVITSSDYYIIKAVAVNITQLTHRNTKIITRTKNSSETSCGGGDLLVGQNLTIISYYIY